MAAQTPTIFISYSRQDSKHLDDLLAVVEPTLTDVSTLVPWTDRDIESGQSWDDEIQDSLERASAAVLLISNHFLRSEYIRKRELPILIPAHLSQRLKLFTLYVSRVPKPALEVRIAEDGDQGTNGVFDLGSIQAENTPDTPLQKMAPPDCTSLFVALAEKLHTVAMAGMAHSSTRGRASAHRPATHVRPGVRPECVIRLVRFGKTIAREFWPSGAERWLKPELKAPNAEDRLELWQPGVAFEGDLLFELLFGQDPAAARAILRNPFGPDSGARSEPGRWPWRLRLALDPADTQLQCLPWTRISYQGVSLAKSGWTVEFMPRLPANNTRPEFANHAFIMPGRILLVFPNLDSDPLAAAHLRDVQHLLQRLWDRPAPILVASDAGQVCAYLRDCSPRLVYVYASAAQVGRDWQIRIPDGAGGQGLRFTELQSAFSPSPPSAIFLGLIGEDAVETFPHTAALAEPPGCKFLALQVTPRGQTELAQRAAMDWLENVLREDERQDPVAALHLNGHLFAACRASYAGWDPQLGGAHLDEDLAELLLDRIAQRARLLQARDDFFDRQSSLRVQCFLALGKRGNLVGRFPQQVITHLGLHDRKGVQPYIHELQLQPTDTDLDRIDTRFRKLLGLRPSVAPAEGLRPHQARLSGGFLMPLLAWSIASQDAKQIQQVARAVIRWSRERLAFQCPDDMRIIALIALELNESAEVESLKEALEDYEESLTSGQEYQRTLAFRFEVLEPLSAVRKRDLKHYFDSEHCTCPDGLRLEYPELLLGGQREMDFDRAIALIREARDVGWHAMRERRPKPES